MSIFIQSYVNSQQNKCYPSKHLNSGKRDEKNKTRGSGEPVSLT
jgi:hypothetical protein